MDNDDMIRYVYDRGLGGGKKKSHMGGYTLYHSVDSKQSHIYLAFQMFT
jgi:hypothetical protein